jgi:hypothetical protein
MKKPTKKEPETKYVKTSLRLPEDLWRATHIRALDERTDMQVIVARALETYLRKGGAR